MTTLFNGDTLEAVAVGSQPTIANGGPFNSVSTTNSTIVASTDIAHPVGNGKTKSVRHLFSGASSSCQGLSPSNIAIPSTYEKICHNFRLYIDTFGATTPVLNMIYLSARYCVYLFNSSGWKIGFTLLHNATSAKVASEATSAAMTTGAWHQIRATYKKLSASAVDLVLEVDGVATAALNQSNANLTVVSGTATYRFGPAAQMTFSSAAANGDKLYTADWFIESYDADAPSPSYVSTGDLRGGLDLMVN